MSLLSMNYERRPPQEDVDAAAAYGLDFIDFTNPFGLFRTEHLKIESPVDTILEPADTREHSSD